MSAVLLQIPRPLAVKEADRLAEWLHLRAVSPAIAEVRMYAEQIRTTELRRSATRLRDLTPDQRKSGLMPELIGAKAYAPEEFKAKVDWMMDRGYLESAPQYADIVRGK